jgi:hypothetical protein
MMRVGGRNIGLEVNVSITLDEGAAYTSLGYKTYHLS